ncbi:hypothetical protein FISHEDRAFT_62412 [Fistulina hepatica ATCC 64428]|nr:hypothetical protein FISHEDRAFT_62412 [Fistulina hepatica ATCC 64428]
MARHVASSQLRRWLRVLPDKGVVFKTISLRESSTCRDRTEAIFPGACREARRDSIFRRNVMQLPMNRSKPQTLSQPWKVSSPESWRDVLSNFFRAMDTQCCKSIQAAQNRRFKGCLLMRRELLAIRVPSTQLKEKACGLQGVQCLQALRGSQETTVANVGMRQDGRNRGKS